jgi:hypothetical protein
MYYCVIIWIMQGLKICKNLSLGIILVCSSCHNKMPDWVAYSSGD